MRLEDVDLELDLATWLVDRDVAVHDDPVAFAGDHLLARQGMAPHHRAELAPVILQRKVGMAGTGDGEIRDLTIEPKVLQILVILDDPLQDRGEVTD